MKVADIMSTDVVTVSPTTSLKNVARLLVEHRISGVPVVDDDGVVLGVVSEGDVLFKERGPLAPRRVLSWLLDGNGEDARTKLDARTAAEAMTSPAQTIESWPLVSSAAARMLDQHVNRLPVVHNEQLVGIVTRADLVRAFIRSDGDIETELRELVRRLLLPDMGDVEIEATEGDIVLTGQVERRSDAEIVTRRASSVPGVVSVESRVTWREDEH